MKMGRQVFAVPFTILNSLSSYAFENLLTTFAGVAG
jgi:hypothetical protein